MAAFTPSLNAPKISRRRKVEPLPLRPRDRAHRHFAFELIVFERRLAENFRQLAEHEAPQQIHLEEPVGAFGIPLRKEEIVLVPCQDVRNAAIVAQNRNRFRAIASRLSFRPLARVRACRWRR